MSRRLLILVSLLVAASCATPYDLKKKDPLASYTTPRPARDVKDCVLKRWKAQFTDVYEEKTETGWQVRFNDTFESNTIALATIEDTGTEVKVDYYNRSEKFQNQHLKEDVLSCK